MTTAEGTRQSGKSAVQEALEAATEEADTPVEPELPGEDVPKARMPGFGRIRTDWSGDDGRTMTMVHDDVAEVIFEAFTSLHVVLHEIHSIVRTPEIENGHPKLDHHGMTVWLRDDFGDPVEDWGQITHGDLKRFIHMINVRLFAWQEQADRFRAEALMAKTQWEESFAVGWSEATGPGKGTDAGKNEAAKRAAFGERYFAVFKTYASHRADSLVRGMERYEQRMKDIYTAKS